MDAFKNRLRKNKKHFGKWARRRNIEAYRIYDKDIPNVPVIIECFGEAVIVWHFPRFDDGAFDGVDAIESAIVEVLGIDASQLFSKLRQKQQKKEQYERLSERSTERTVQENGLDFRVNLSDYLDIGLFLDQRTNREEIQHRSRGKRVLNLFAYTGSFSVYAAAGGATSTLTVDLSNTYLKWAESNMQLNSFEGENHQYLQADVFEFLRDAYAEDRAYDLILCDPPTFSNSKRMLGTLDVQRDHSGLINLALKLLRPEGQLFFSTNRRKFTLDREALEGVVLEEWSPKQIPDDFRDKKVHQAWILGNSESP